MNILRAASAGAFGAQASGAAHIGIRPEHISLVSPDEGHLVGKVLIAEYTGAATLLHVALDSSENCLVVVDGEAPAAGIYPVQPRRPSRNTSRPPPSSATLAAYKITLAEVADFSQGFWLPAASCPA